MDDIGWKLHVASQLGSVATGLEALCKQVERQNGNVARIWERMAEIEKHAPCSGLAAKVNLLETDAASYHEGQRAAEAATKPWKDLFARVAERIITAVTGALLIIALLHPGDFAKVFKP